MKKIFSVSIGIGIVCIIFFIISNSESATKQTQQNAAITSSQNDAKDQSLQDLNSKEFELSEKQQRQLREININADRKIEQLIEQAEKEYASKKRDNQDTTAIGKKYKAILEHDERKIKAEFEIVYQNLQGEQNNAITHRTIRKKVLEIYELKRIERRVNFEKELENLG